MALTFLSISNHQVDGTDLNVKSFSFSQKIDSYQNLSKEIASLHITVPLNMLCLNCDDVNQELSARAERLADRMIHYVVDQNRDKNRGYAWVLEKLLQFLITSCIHVHIQKFNNLQVVYALLNASLKVYP